MSPSSQIRTRLIELVDDYKIFEGQETNSILDIDLIDSGLIDSLTMMRMQAVIEDEFGVEIPEGALLTRLRTFNDLVDFVAEQTNAS